MTKQILIADDSPFLREQLRLAIEQQHPGWNVSEAVDGADAVRKSQQLAPDAVVLDLSMPEMGGSALAAALSRLNPAVKILFMTGAVGGESVGESVPTSARILVKPFTGEKLLTSVHEVLAVPSVASPA